MRKTKRLGMVECEDAFIPVGSAEPQLGQAGNAGNAEPQLGRVMENEEGQAGAWRSQGAPRALPESPLRLVSVLFLYISTENLPLLHHAHDTGAAECADQRRRLRNPIDTALAPAIIGRNLSESQGAI